MAKQQHFTKNFIRTCLKSVPTKQRSDFEKYSIEKNLERFFVLPFFNISIQICCIFIYLYVYPIVFPDKRNLDPGLFLAVSGLYLIVNLAAVLILGYFRRHNDYNQRHAARIIDLFIVGYIWFEAFQVIFELAVSGNIYRFLATFFVVAFFPIVSRRKRLFFMLLYTAIAEVSLSLLERFGGVPAYSYPQIIIAILVLGIVAANIYFSNVVANFTLQMDLIESNHKLMILNEKLEHLSVTDALTGAANRRALSEYAERCWKMAQRSQSRVSMMMIDIDNFKTYNDTYGHQKGDEVLVTVARFLLMHVRRAIDIVARYGGEEFIVILPHISAEDSHLMAKEILTGIRRLEIPHCKNNDYGCISVSIGLASARPSPQERYEELLKLADEALYKAKAAGRNCIYLSGKEVVRPSEPAS